MFVGRKSKSLILSLSLSLIVMLAFSGTMVVLGDAYGNGGSYGAGSIPGCNDGYNCIWSGRTGVRFSLVDANGKKVSGTNHVDLWVKSSIYNYNKLYQLPKSGGGLIWDFSGAWYGRQIKQDVIASPAGLSFGDYFGLSNVHYIEDVLGANVFEGYYNSVDGDWEPKWVQTAVDWLKDKTSESNTVEMDNLLRKMGYNGEDGLGPSVAAANKGYYLQYEPLIHHGRIGSGLPVNYIFIGTVTEYYKYDKAKSQCIYESPWFSRGNSTSIYIALNKAPSNFTTGTGADVENLLKKDASGKIYGEGVAHIWISDLFDGFSCSEAINYINSKYTPGTTNYHNAVTKLRNGTFKYTDASGVERVQLTPYSYQYLKKSVYTTLPGGKAACKDPEASSCQDAIDHINANPSKYPKGSDDYHDAVAQVKNKTFTYIISGEIFTINASENTDFDYLDKSLYELAGGEAACKNRDVCDHFGANVSIDNCTSGKTFFGDINDPEAWLVCGIAYTKDGVIYSSDNTGHAAEGGDVVGNSDYCEVFCYEEIETRFPTSVSGVKSGQTFTWGLDALGTFGSIKVKKKCSTQNYVEGVSGYRFAEWSSDYKKNEKELVKYYMNKAAYEKAKNNITTTATSKYVACEGCPYTCGTAPSTYSCDKRYKGTATVEEQSVSYYDGYLGTITGRSDELSFSTGYEYNSASAAKAAAKTALKEKLQDEADSELNQYYNRRSEESTLLKKISQCTNKLAYNNKAIVRFVFAEPENDAYGSNDRNFSINDTLEEIETYDTEVVTKDCKKKNVYTYECTGTGSSATCARSMKKVLDCSDSGVKWNINATYTYKYPTDKFKWYSLKTDGTLINEENKGSEDEAFFYSIGFGLPTAFSLTDGKYKLKVVVSNFGDSATTTGDQDYNTTNGHFAPLGESTVDGSGFDYSCVYEVENEIFGYECQYDSSGKLTDDSPSYCDVKEDSNSDGELIGIDITFRLVTLLSKGDDINKAFPGVDGDGRLPKGNWSIGIDEIKKVLDADVYKNDQAMYEIMLDVNAIQTIRKDNERYFDAGKDPYTSYVDATGGQKVYCATGSGEQKYCASTFISKLYVGSGLNYRLLGTCLPKSDTLGRAQHVLEKGCDASYTYPTINWSR